MRHSPAELRRSVLHRLDLARSDRFVWTAADIEHDRVTLRWWLDGVGELTEEFAFSGVDLLASEDRGPAVRGAVTLLHLTAGVSYLKSTLPPVLDPGLAAPTPAARALLTALVTDGLGELAFEAGVDLRDWFAITEVDVDDISPPADVTLPSGPLVPIGGGKDSIVTLDALGEQEPTLFAVNPKGPIERTLAAAGRPAITVTRTLDPVLFELNARGAVNGHVPVTAIVSAAAVVAAAAGGHRAVVMSNERSADQANVVRDGLAVNHQWSKTSMFEAAFAALVRAQVHPSLTYASLLRPASELAIARRFAALDGWDRVFNSCNRAFHLQGATREWCGECPKCHFVFLALAPFMAPDRLAAIFGADLLDDPALVPAYAELAGLEGHKPFECVGEVEESRAALAHLAGTPAWGEHAVVRTLAGRTAGAPDLTTFLTPADAGTLPPDLAAAFRQAFGEAGA